MPAGAVYVGRPTKWGNPFIVGSDVQLSGSCDDVRPWFTASFFDLATTRMTPTMAVELYDGELDAHLDPDTYSCRGVVESPNQGDEIRAALRGELRGHDLVCWCPLDQPCHADVLLRIANEDAS